MIVCEEQRWVKINQRTPLILHPSPSPIVHQLESFIYCCSSSRTRFSRSTKWIYISTQIFLVYNSLKIIGFFSLFFWVPSTYVCIIITKMITQQKAETKLLFVPLSIPWCTHTSSMKHGHQFYGTCLLVVLHRSDLSCWSVLRRGSHGSSRWYHQAVHLDHLVRTSVEEDLEHFSSCARTALVLWTCAHETSARTPLHLLSLSHAFFVYAPLTVGRRHHPIMSTPTWTWRASLWTETGHQWPSCVLLLPWTIRWVGDARNTHMRVRYYSLANPCAGHEKKREKIRWLS